MRRALLALITAAGLTAAMLGITLSPAGAQTLVIDLGATVTDNPDPIGAGNGTIYTVTVTNHEETGLLTASDVRLNATTTGTISTGDSNLADDSADGQCGVTANTVDCEFDNLASGASRSISVVSVAGTSNISLTAVTSHGPSNPLAPVLDLEQGNNSDTEETTVDPNLSTGYVAPGECTTHTSPGHDHDLCVPADEENGVIVTVFTGGNAEDGGAVTTIDFSTDPEFQANVELDLNFGLGAPCRGLGAPSGCTDLRWRKTVDDTFELMDRCPGTEGEPCVFNVYKVETSSGSDIHFEVNMHSTDPQIGPLNVDV